MENTEKQVVWKVHCPTDGPQLLVTAGLHVYVRTRCIRHIVTYFCPACHEQRYQLIDKKVTDALTAELGVAYTIMMVPLEALEMHYGSPIKEIDVKRAVDVMSALDFGPPRLV